MRYVCGRSGALAPEIGGIQMQTLYLVFTIGVTFAVVFFPILLILIMIRTEHVRSRGIGR